MAKLVKFRFVHMSNYQVSCRGGEKTTQLYSYSVPNKVDPQ